MQRSMHWVSSSPGPEERKQKSSSPGPAERQQKSSSPGPEERHQKSDCEPWGEGHGDRA